MAVVQVSSCGSYSVPGLGTSMYPECGPKKKKKKKRKKILFTFFQPSVSWIIWSQTPFSHAIHNYLYLWVSCSEMPVYRVCSIAWQTFVAHLIHDKIRVKQSLLTYIDSWSVFNKYLWSLYFVLSALPGSGDTGLAQIYMVLALIKYPLQRGRHVLNHKQPPSLCIQSKYIPKCYGRKEQGMLWMCVIRWP